RRSISRRTSAGGGAREPGAGAAAASSGSYSPLIHDRRRPRGFDLAAERALRRIASASIAVSPGTADSPSPTSVAPQDGQVVSWAEGRTGAHPRQRHSGRSSP